jgi:hypothetical protein
MKKILAGLSALVLALALVPTPAFAQCDFSRFVVIGDSEGAGVESNCLAKHGQTDSFGAIIARQAGVDFQQPIVEEPGLGGCLVLKSLAPSFGVTPSTGVPSNLALPRPYNNLSVPGCSIIDMLVATTGSQTISAGSCRSLIDLVLRNQALHLGSMVDQAVALHPTFVILENVGNDYLGAVLSGTAIDGVTITPVAAFTAAYQATLAKLKAATPNGVVFGIADITNIPFATTIPPVLTSGGKVVLNPATGQPIPLLGPRCPAGIPVCPIPSDTLVTLPAANFLATGYGVPCAVAPALPNCNKPLPDSANPATGTPGVLLYADEVALLKQRSIDYNNAVKAATAAAGYKFFDLNALLSKARTEGFEIGGMTVTSAFLTGGAFSYDGFHLTSIGYAVLADELIKFIDASFGCQIEEPNLATFLFNGNTSGIMPTLPSLRDQMDAAAEIYSLPEARDFLMKFIPPISHPSLTVGNTEPVEKGHGARTEHADRQ